MPYTDEVKCRNCGKKSAPSAARCLGCGNSLLNCPLCDATVQPDLPQCVACNHKLLPAEQICSACSATSSIYATACYSCRQPFRFLCNSCSEPLSDNQSICPQCARPHRIEQYRIIQQIGSGTFGAVYLVVDEQLSQPFAIKQLWENFAMDQSFLRRFEDEARIAARFRDSQFVLRVNKFGAVKSRPYIVMDFEEGGTLAELVKVKGRISVTDALCFAMQLLCGLAEIHSHGRVHRDLKPANVLLRNRRGIRTARLGDLGTATDPLEGTLSAQSIAFGSIPWTAPEQFTMLRSELDARCDLFAFGTTLYYMLSGCKPFEVSPEASSKEAAYLEAVSGGATALGVLNPDFLSFPDIDHFLARLMAVNREMRPASAHEALEELMIVSIQYCPESVWSFHRLFPQVQSESTVLATFLHNRPAPPPDATPIPQLDSRSMHAAYDASAKASPLKAVRNRLAWLTADPRRVALAASIAILALIVALYAGADAISRPAAPSSRQQIATFLDTQNWKAAKSVIDRTPDPKEKAALSKLFDNRLAQFQRDRKAALAKLLQACNLLAAENLISALPEGDPVRATLLGDFEQARRNSCGQTTEIATAPAGGTNYIPLDPGSDKGSTDKSSGNATNQATPTETHPVNDVHQQIGEALRHSDFKTAYSAIDSALKQKSISVPAGASLFAQVAAQGVRYQSQVLGDKMGSRAEFLQFLSTRSPVTDAQRELQDQWGRQLESRFETARGNRDYAAYIAETGTILRYYPQSKAAALRKKMQDIQKDEQLRIQRSRPVTPAN